MGDSYRMFELILDAGEHVYKHLGIYRDETEARDAATGNGEVVRVKDVTAEYPLSQEKIYLALQHAGFGKYEAESVHNFIAHNYANVIRAQRTPHTGRQCGYSGHKPAGMEVTVC